MPQTQQTTKPETTFNVELFELNKLKAHEEVDPAYLRELKQEIELDGFLRFAIAVDKDRNIILDGHHRVAALKMLGCNKIPVIFVDYNSPMINVTGHKSANLTKKDVIEAGLSPKKLPPKTSKHLIKLDGEWKHISAIQKQVNIPLKELK
ncbi:MAG: ParB N-terminal domain-containing protein [Candidatus Bathyarchaeia archaeon]